MKNLDKKSMLEGLFLFKNISMKYPIRLVETWCDEVNFQHMRGKTILGWTIVYEIILSI